MVPCKSTASFESTVSFEWSHHRISFTDSNVGTTLHVSIIDSGSERIRSALKGMFKKTLGKALYSVFSHIILVLLKETM